MKKLNEPVREHYQPPRLLGIAPLPRALNILETLSFEGTFDDIEDGGEI